MLKTLLKLASAYSGHRTGFGQGSYGKPWKKGWRKKARYDRGYEAGWGPPGSPPGYPGYPAPYGYRPKGLKGFLLQALLSRFLRPR
jgi:hypothetical protein